MIYSKWEGIGRILKKQHADILIANIFRWFADFGVIKEACTFHDELSVVSRTLPIERVRDERFAVV